MFATNQMNARVDQACEMKNTPDTRGFWYQFCCICCKKINCFTNEPIFSYSAESSYEGHLYSMRKTLSKIFETESNTFNGQVFTSYRVIFNFHSANCALTESTKLGECASEVVSGTCASRAASHWAIRYTSGNGRAWLCCWPPSHQHFRQWNLPG